MSNEVNDRKEKLVKAGFVAVDELIKVLNSPILGRSELGETDVSAEKMKMAASAKRLALEDSLAMLQTITQLEEELSEDSPEEKEEVKEELKVDFDRPEKRAARK